MKINRLIEFDEALIKVYNCRRKRYTEAYYGHQVFQATKTGHTEEEEVIFDVDLEEQEADEQSVR